MQLNPKQQQAVDHTDGNLLIIAGAGSWKTATLTARVEHMIRDKHIAANSILMVTFTNKAASEMRERVAKTLWIQAGKSLYQNRNSLPLIGTFHSLWIYFLKEILGKYSPEEINIWLKKDFVIYDESDKISVLKWIIKNELQLDEKQFPAKQIAFYISNAKNALITAKAFESQVDSQIKEVVFQVYIKYEYHLQQNNAMDFDDILIKTLALLQIPQVLKHYQEKYKYLMVDEYQDTNVPQYNIVKLLSSKYGNLAVVWDDSQSIYSWRWADMTNIINFKRDYPDALIVKLEQNYRSTDMILKWANAVIAKNTSGIKKELWTNQSSDKKIQYIEAPDDKVEAGTIANIIREESETNYKNNLILYRTNAQSRQIEEVLMMKNIPYRVIGGLKFYDRKEIKDLLAYLRMIHNPADGVSMKRVINTPPRKIGAKSIATLDNYRESFGLGYKDVIHNVDEIEELRAGARESIKNFGILLDSFIQTSKKIVVSELISEIIKSIEYDSYIKDGLSEEEKSAKQENINELITVASQYNGMEPRESLWQFLDDIALISDLDNADNSTNCVTLMTIHTAKWLEEHTVFVTGLEEWIFPSFRSVNNTHALEEERRLMYVAMTRAREQLYISRAKERFHFWDYVRNPESRFIAEIPGEYREEYPLSDGGFFSTRSQTPSENFSFWWAGPTTRPIMKPTANNDVSLFSVWDKVSHPKFGWWIITALNGETADIVFSGKWTKKMNIRVAPVKKLS